MPDGLFLTGLGIIATVLSWWFTFPSPAAKSLQATFRWISVSWMLIGLGQMTLDQGHGTASSPQQIEMIVMGGFLCAAGIMLMIGHARREFRRVQLMIKQSEIQFEANRKARLTQENIEG